jgi:hypothetical protein
MPSSYTPLSVAKLVASLADSPEKRMEALQRVKFYGFQMVISELEVEQDYLRRAKRCLEE